MNFKIVKNLSVVKIKVGDSTTSLVISRTIV